MNKPIQLTEKPLVSIYEREGKEHLKKHGAVKFFRLPVTYTPMLQWHTDRRTELFTQLHGFDEDGGEVGYVSLDMGLMTLFEEPRQWSDSIKAKYTEV